MLKTLKGLPKLSCETRYKSNFKRVRSGEISDCSSVDQLAIYYYWTLNAALFFMYIHINIVAVHTDHTGFLPAPVVDSGFLGAEKENSHIVYEVCSEHTKSLALFLFL